MPSAGVLVQPDRSQMSDPEALWRQLMQIVGRDQGLPDWGSAVNHTSFSSASAYAHTIKNNGAGGFGLQVLSSAGASRLTVADTGVGIGGGLAITGNLTLNGDLLASPDATHDIGASGASRFRDFYLSRNAVIGGTLGVTGTIIGSSTVQGTQLISTVLTASALSPLVVSSQIMVTNLNANYIGGTDLAGLVAEFVDAAGDTMTGLLTMEPSGATDQIIKLKNSSSSGGFFLGASSGATPDLVFKNNGNTQRARVFGAGGLMIGAGTTLTSTELLEIASGGLRVTTGGIVLAGSGNIDGSAGVAGQLRIGGVIVNAASFTGTEKLKVTGDVLFDTGGLALSAGNIDVQSGVAGQIRIGAVIVNAASLTGTEKLKVSGNILTTGDLYAGGETTRSAVYRRKITVANNATSQIHATTAGPQGFIQIQDSASFGASFLSRAIDVVSLALDDATRWSVTSGTATKTNVYKTAGTLTIENKTGGSLDYHIQIENYV